MDLGRAPLLRVHAAAEPGTGRWLALVRVHHLVVDHTALDVVLGDVRALLCGQEDRLPVPLPFRDFVAQARLGMPREEHERFFAGLLGDVTEPTAAFGLADVLGDGTGAAEARLMLDEGSGGAGPCGRAGPGVSPATLFHLVWARVLAAVSGREDVVFGTVLFGRMRPGPGRTGCRARSLIRCRCGLRSGTERADAVAGLQGQLAGLLAHEHAPLALAQQASGVVAPAPLFTSLFNYRHTPSRRAPRAAGPGLVASR